MLWVLKELLGVGGMGHRRCCRGGCAEELGGDFVAIKGTSAAKEVHVDSGCIADL